MRLSLNARKILHDLRCNLDRQDYLNMEVLRLRHLDRHAAVQDRINELVDVVSRQGVLVSRLKREGFDQDVLVSLINGG